MSYHISAKSVFRGSNWFSWIVDVSAHQFGIRRASSRRTISEMVCLYRCLPPVLSENDENSSVGNLSWPRLESGTYRVKVCSVAAWGSLLGSAVVPKFWSVVTASAWKWSQDCYIKSQKRRAAFEFHETHFLRREFRSFFSERFV